MDRPQTSHLALPAIPEYRDVSRNYGLKNLNYLIPERQTDYGQEAMKVGSFEAGRRDIFFNRKKQN
jgi:hypothetical protein